MHRRTPLAPRVLLALSALFVVVVTLAACTREVSAEEQIKARLAEGVKALEEKDVKRAGALLAEGYKDSNGRDHRQMKALAFFVLRSGPVRISLSDEQIEVEESGTRAKASMKVTALQTTGAPTTVGDLMPRGRAVPVQLDLVKSDDEWLITAIEGDGMGASDFE